MLNAIKEFLTQFQILDGFVTPVAVAIEVVAVAILAIIANVIAKSVIVTVIHRVLKRATSTRDDILIRRKVFGRLSHLAPALVI